MSEPGETRTLDPRIKSALLYRLSYRLIEKCGNQTVNQHLAAMPRRQRVRIAGSCFRAPPARGRRVLRSRSNVAVELAARIAL